MLLRIATAFTGLTIAAGLALLIWSAANSNDLVIDNQVPPHDLAAARGLSGLVVAAKLGQDRGDAGSDRVAARGKSYANGLPVASSWRIFPKPAASSPFQLVGHFLREKRRAGPLTCMSAEKMVQARTK